MVSISHIAHSFTIGHSEKFLHVGRRIGAQSKLAILLRFRVVDGCISIATQSSITFDG